MPILESPNGPQTLEDKQRQTANTLRRICQQAFQQLLSSLQNGQRWTYTNPLGLTEEQVFAAFPPAEAAELKEFAEIVTEAINRVRPGTIPVGELPVTPPADTLSGTSGA